MSSVQGLGFEVLEPRRCLRRVAPAGASERSLLPSENSVQHGRLKHVPRRHGRLDVLFAAAFAGRLLLGQDGREIPRELLGAAGLQRLGLEVNPARSAARPVREVTDSMVAGPPCNLAGNCAAQLRRSKDIRCIHDAAVHGRPDGSA